MNSVLKIFISHASEDKDEIARPLAEELRNQGYEVWYDEYSLKLGDSLSREIDKGLSTSDFGIVILSKSFFSKKWPTSELAGLVSREMGSSSSKSIILPIWHNIDADEVRSYSPILADRLAVSTSKGIAQIISEINRATEFLTSVADSNQSAPTTKMASAKNILRKITPAGPIQPDGGYFPSSINVIEELVDEWDEYGYVSILVKTNQKMDSKRRKELFHEEKYVFLRPDHAMHQVRIEVIDMSYMYFGMVWTPPNISDNDYHRAIEFFLLEMGLLSDEIVKFKVSPIINSDDSFWVIIS